MAEFKRRTLHLSSGKQVKLFGNSIAIGRSLEIGEGYAPNIFSCLQQEQEIIKSTTTTAKPTGDSVREKEKPQTKTISTVSNPFRLSETDLMEIADYNIRLWMDLKDSIRKHGINSPNLFNSESLRS
ncbi:hypothetical protein DC498_22055 [Terrimonas sp.]|uniref:hypothetical protein n=1 Tax=Terrimonas sp. TaxID=1914338 RepID=UPI000D515F2D|nr:hypothetical protein [Terrimonas sp.]PVD50008.1 hypothetical protein DC498_22055 [Terrimonas sp.]